MDQILKCRDTGLICNSIICGDTKEELLKKAGEHVEFIHYMNGFPKALYEKARTAIHEGFCEEGIEGACAGGECGV